MNAQNLDKITMGVDRGVVIPAVSSNCANHDYTIIKSVSLAKKRDPPETLTTDNVSRAKRVRELEGNVKSVTRCHAHASNVRSDFVHKAIRKLVDSDAEVIVF